MKQRGKKSAAALGVATSPISAKNRPEPPNDLTPEQRLEWVLVVNAAPVDWFSPCNLQVLAQYTRHAVASRRVAQLIEQAESDDEFSVLEYEKLLKMQERESRVITTLLTKMRLTQQSIFSARKTRPHEDAGAAKPWEKNDG